MALCKKYYFALNLFILWQSTFFNNCLFFSKWLIDEGPDLFDLDNKIPDPFKQDSITHVLFLLQIE
jgi:hypothetical protein